MAVVDENPSTSAGPRGFAEGLFPPGPAERRPRGRLVLGYALAFLAAVGFQLLTPAGLSRLDRMWAEDGARFLLDALTQPFTANVVAPYGGYLHTLPRLLAEVASLFPLDWAAAVIAVSAAALRAVVALTAFAASAGYLRSTPVRFALAALVVVLPAGNSETLDNLANVHWFLVYGVFWALLWRSAPLVPVAVLVVLATLSSPLAFFLAPVALLRLALPGRRDRVIPIVFLVAAAAQGLAMAFAERTPYSHDAVDPVQVVLAGLLRVPVVAFLGSEPVDEVYPEFGNVPVVIALLLVVVPIVAGLRWADRAGRFLVVLGAVSCVLVIAVSLIANWSAALQVQKPGVVMAAQRYSIAPALFLFTAMAAGVDSGLRGRFAGVTAWAGRVLVGVAVLVGVVLHFTGSAGVLDGRPWDVGVAGAEAQCAAGDRPAGRIVHEPEGWYFDLPCEYLAD
ncbi:hypothetical protein [Saccharothrix hoggarensis]|uniref:DUF2029 domain-containing protein n=1 Tax=Saccharothrix hoggarensis TaxID=913853 RepID=A0ABW3QRI8_9PSEU